MKNNRAKRITIFCDLCGAEAIGYADETAEEIAEANNMIIYHVKDQNKEGVYPLSIFLCEDCANFLAYAEAGKATVKEAGQGGYSRRIYIPKEARAGVKARVQFLPRWMFKEK